MANEIPIIAPVSKQGRGRGAASRLLILLGSNTGSQLLEFGLSLPFLMVMLVGMLDFAQAYNLKQKLTNACREGARFGATQNTLDLSCGGASSCTPASVTGIRDVVASYLTNAGVTTCSVGSTPTQVGLKWSYTSSSSGCSKFQLVVHRGYTFQNGSVNVVATYVSLAYPYTWSYNHVIGLLVHHANPTLPSTVTANSLMQNLP